MIQESNKLPIWAMALAAVGLILFAPVVPFVFYAAGLSPWWIALPFLIGAALSFHPNARTFGLLSRGQLRFLNTTAAAILVFFTLPISFGALDEVDAKASKVVEADPTPTKPASDVDTEREVASVKDQIQRPTKTSPTTTPLDTTVDEVLDTYAENQIAGIRRFNDREVRISGVAVRVREALGTGILVLRSPNDPDYVIELGFNEAAEPELAEVRTGRTTTAKCHQTLELAGSIVMADCRSVSQS